MITYRYLLPEESKKVSLASESFHIFKEDLDPTLSYTRNHVIRDVQILIEDGMSPSAIYPLLADKYGFMLEEVGVLKRSDYFKDSGIQKERNYIEGLKLKLPKLFEQIVGISMKEFRDFGHVGMVYDCLDDAKLTFYKHEVLRRLDDEKLEDILSEYGIPVGEYGKAFEKAKTRKILDYRKKKKAQTKLLESLDSLAERFIGSENIKKVASQESEYRLARLEALRELPDGSTAREEFALQDLDFRLARLESLREQNYQNCSEATSAYFSRGMIAEPSQLYDDEKQLLGMLEAATIMISLFLSYTKFSFDVTLHKYNLLRFFDLDSMAYDFFSTNVKGEDKAEKTITIIKKHAATLSDVIDYLDDPESFGDIKGNLKYFTFQERKDRIGRVIKNRTTTPRRLKNISAREEHEVGIDEYFSVTDRTIDSLVTAADQFESGTIDMREESYQIMDYLHVALLNEGYDIAHADFDGESRIYLSFNEIESEDAIKQNNLSGQHLTEEEIFPILDLLLAEFGLEHSGYRLDGNDLEIDLVRKVSEPSYDNRDITYMVIEIHQALNAIRYPTRRIYRDNAGRIFVEPISKEQLPKEASTVFIDYLEDALIKKQYHSKSEDISGPKIISEKDGYVIEFPKWIKRRLAAKYYQEDMKHVINQILDEFYFPKRELNFDGKNNLKIENYQDELLPDDSYSAVQHVVGGILRKYGYRGINGITSGGNLLKEIGGFLIELGQSGFLPMYTSSDLAEVAGPAHPVRSFYEERQNSMLYSSLEWAQGEISAISHDDSNHGTGVIRTKKEWKEIFPQNKVLEIILNHPGFFGTSMQKIFNSADDYSAQVSAKEIILSINESRDKALTDLILGFDRLVRFKTIRLANDDRNIAYIGNTVTLGDIYSQFLFQLTETAVTSYSPFYGSLSTLANSFVFWPKSIINEMGELSMKGEPGRVYETMRKVDKKVAEKKWPFLELKLDGDTLDGENIRKALPLSVVDPDSASENTDAIIDSRETMREMTRFQRSRSLAAPVPYNERILIHRYHEGLTFSQLENEMALNDPVDEVDRRERARQFYNRGMSRMSNPSRRKKIRDMID